MDLIGRLIERSGAKVFLAMTFNAVPTAPSHVGGRPNKVSKFERVGRGCAGVDSQ
jgi:hypothetical protein